MKKTKFVSIDRSGASGHDEPNCPRIIKIRAILTIFGHFKLFADLKGVTLVKNRQILHQIKNPKNDPSKNDPSKNPPKKPWHFFRFLAACCAPPPKIEKNAWTFLAFFPIFGGVLRTAAKNRKKCETKTFEVGLKLKFRS